MDPDIAHTLLDQIVQHPAIEQAMHLVAALIVGGLIGMERTFSGRPAGMRTHVLVCMASAVLMMMTVYQDIWLETLPLETIRTDPTRMAQGVMTGIGFLGAGVIFKEGLTVRGLTTAASIWITAAIGTLLGVGFFTPALIACGLTLLTLSVLRLGEDRIPTRHHAEHVVQFERDAVLSESRMRELFEQFGFRILKMGYELTDNNTVFEYHMVVRTVKRRSFQTIAKELLETPGVIGFRITPLAD